MKRMARVIEPGKWLGPLAAAFGLASCSSFPPRPPAAIDAPAPVARSNWTVARSADQVFAFYGLGPGKTYRDIARDAHAYDLRTGRWRNLGEIPVDAGRLASAAVGVGSDVYLLGGYTVAADGAEKSAAEVLRFEPRLNRYTRVTVMPRPVDDSVALAWRDRWIILVSGWHDTANVRDVQFYDTQSGKWIAGTAWPGMPVFGHVGGIVADSMLVCDGVAATVDAGGKNRFAMSNECWRGNLDPATPGRIAWSAVPPHPGLPLYRSGAVGIEGWHGGGAIWIAGGSTRAYNYDGIGYDGPPAEASARILAFDLRCSRWTEHAPLPAATMDFRGMIATDNQLLLFGGMDANQRVKGEVLRIPLGPRESREEPCRQR